MKGTYCNRKGGWTRVGYLNMIVPASANCPPGLTNINHSGPVCGRSASGLCFCFANYCTLRIKYFKVGVQVKEYQISLVDTFAQLNKYKI